MAKQCERCNSETNSKSNRFCRDCQVAIKNELLEAGYLTPVPWRTRFRPPGAEENTHETKRGID